MYRHEISMQVTIFPPRITLPQILAQPPGPLNQTVPLSPSPSSLQGMKLRLIQAPMQLNFSLWRPNPGN